MTEHGKANCATLAYWFATEHRDTLQINTGNGWRHINTSDSLLDTDNPRIKFRLITSTGNMLKPVY